MTWISDRSVWLTAIAKKVANSFNLWCFTKELQKKIKHQATSNNIKTPKRQSDTILSYTKLLKLTLLLLLKSLQLCPTLCDRIDGSPPGSSVPGILQARILEWVAISFSNALKWKVKVKSLSRVRLLGTPWTAAHQAPPSMGFSRLEYWSDTRQKQKQSD